MLLNDHVPALTIYHFPLGTRLLVHQKGAECCSDLGRSQ